MQNQKKSKPEHVSWKFKESSTGWIGTKVVIYYHLRTHFSYVLGFWIYRVMLTDFIRNLWNIRNPTKKYTYKSVAWSLFKSFNIFCCFILQERIKNSLKLGYIIGFGYMLCETILASLTTSPLPHTPLTYLYCLLSSRPAHIGPTLNLRISRPVHTGLGPLKNVLIFPKVDFC